MANFKLPGLLTSSFNSILKLSTTSVSNLATATLNASGVRFGAVFRAAYSAPLSGFYISHGSNTGTPSGIQVDLYAVDTNGLPTGSSLASITYTPIASLINRIALSSPYTVVQDTCYALIWQNTNPNPSTNCPTFTTHAQDSTFNYLYLGSADGGLTWPASAGTFLGSKLLLAPVYSVTGPDGWFAFANQAVTVGNSMYNTAGSRQMREGVRVQFPTDVLLWGLGFRASSNVGSPTFNCQGEICSATATLSVSDTQIPVSTITNGSTITFRWSAPYRLLANTVYYLCTSPASSQAGDASNYYRLQQGIPLLKPGNNGPFIDCYQSSAVGTPSFSQLASFGPAIDLYIEIPQASSQYAAPGADF